MIAALMPRYPLPYLATKSGFSISPVKKRDNPILNMIQYTATIRASVLPWSDRTVSYLLNLLKQEVC